MLISRLQNCNQHTEDYENIIKAAKSSSVKSRQLAAQLIPRFFKHFPGLSENAVHAHLDLCEAEEIGVGDLLLFDCNLICSQFCSQCVELSNRIV